MVSKRDLQDQLDNYKEFYKDASERCSELLRDQAAERAQYCKALAYCIEKLGLEHSYLIPEHERDWYGDMSYNITDFIQDAIAAFDEGDAATLKYQREKRLAGKKKEDK